MRNLLFLILFCFSIQGSVFSQEYYTVKEFLQSHQEASDELVLIREKMSLKTVEIKALEQDVIGWNAEKEELLRLLNVDDVLNASVEKQISEYRKRDEFETQEEYDDRMLKIDAVTEQIKKKLKDEMNIDENAQKLTALSKKIEDKKQVRVRLSEILSELEARVDDLTSKIAEFAPDKITEIPYLYTLSQYDADGEFFVLSRKGSESLLASVPRNEARFFKTNYETIKIYSHSYNSIASLGEKQYILTQFVLKDSRDAKEYRIVKVGSQVWMAENLAYETDRGSYPYDRDEVNVEKYGRLYTWKTLVGACPSGWHVPSDVEWKTFETAIGVEESELDLMGARGVNTGTGIKSESGWKAGGNGTNKYGLNIVPAGTRSIKGVYASIEELARVWTSTQKDSEEAYSRVLFYHSDKIVRFVQKKDIASSIRCIKN